MCDDIDNGVNQMYHSEIQLKTKLVGDIEGEFFVPSYQRGFRWGNEEVIRLLDDVFNNGARNYCLQPIVVRKSENYYELIDGQQRLTTLYLIYFYLHEASNEFIDGPKFSLTYETRAKSKDFLRTLDLSLKESNIDFWFICQAYENIKTWFGRKEKKSVLSNFNKYFDENVKVIWYEVGQNEDAIALFTRLNIGKIPLTSSELIKAIFLSNQAMPTERQEEIALQWDNIERDLHDDHLWYFLSNQSRSNYPTRIDLVLNLVAHKDEKNREQYYTFFYFDDLRKKHSLNDLWQRIQQTFLVLKDWHSNHEFYHKIGYLIASESSSLQELFNLAAGKTKRQFKLEIDQKIKDSIKISGQYLDLNYLKRGDYAIIQKLLLLFNVESVRQNGEQTEWFPFDKYKFRESGRISWSLEHIHAQQANGLRTQESWKEWIRLHLPSVKTIDEKSNLISEMQRCLDSKKIYREEFDRIWEEAIKILSAEEDHDSEHSIENLALLNSIDNAALSNSTFDVKRNNIIEMDKRGKYIPFCTKMVFLKYYTPSEKNQLHFWGRDDKNAYITAMDNILKKYLEKPIQSESEKK